MFTRLSNFTYPPLEIANINEIQKNNNLMLSIHIQKCEKEVLRMILGDCLYADLMAECELDEKGYWKLKDDADAKWSRLLYGHSWEPETQNNVSGLGCGCCGGGNCGTHYWDGLLNVVASIPGESSGDEPDEIIETLMSYYIYNQFALNTRSRSMGVGEGNGEAQNAEMTITAHKRIDAWNQMVQKVKMGGLGGRVSLQQFLREFSTDYPNAVFLCFNVIPYQL